MFSGNLTLLTAVQCSAAGPTNLLANPRDRIHVSRNLSLLQAVTCQKLNEWVRARYQKPWSIRISHNRRFYHLWCCSFWTQSIQNHNQFQLIIRFRRTQKECLSRVDLFIEQTLNNRYKKIHFSWNALFGSTTPTEIRNSLLKNFPPYYITSCAILMF